MPATASHQPSVANAMEWSLQVLNAADHLPANALALYIQLGRVANRHRRRRQWPREFRCTSQELLCGALASPGAVRRALVALREPRDGNPALIEYVPSGGRRGSLYRLLSLAEDTAEDTPDVAETDAATDADPDPDPAEPDHIVNGSPPQQPASEPATIPATVPPSGSAPGSATAWEPIPLTPGDTPYTRAKEKDQEEREKIKHQQQQQPRACDGDPDLVRRLTDHGLPGYQAEALLNGIAPARAHEIVDGYDACARKGGVGPGLLVAALRGNYVPRGGGGGGGFRPDPGRRAPQPPSPPSPPTQEPAGERQHAEAGAWNAVLESLRAEFEPFYFNSWFSSLEPAGIDGRTLVLRIASPHILDWLRTYHTADILEAAREPLGIEAIQWQGE